MRWTSLLVGLILAGSSPGVAGNAPTPIQPPARPIVLDGRLDPAEWGLSSPQVPPGGDVHLRADDRFVYFGVRGNAVHSVHLYLAAGEEVHVLHASGSLGRAVYRKAGGDLWNATSPFEWKVRDPRIRRPEDPPDVEAERRLYLGSQGWAANTVMTGERGQVEFQLDRAYIERQGAKIALVYFWQEADGKTRIVHWPEGAEVAPEEEKLLMGETGPARLTTRGWYQPSWAPKAGEINN